MSNHQEIRQPSKRKRFLVDRRQYQIIFTGVLYFLAVVATFGAAVFVPLIIQLNGSIESPAVQEAAQQFLVLHNRVWPPLLLVFGFLVLHTVILSHRFAGPLYNLRKYLDRLGDGDLSTDLKLRANDYLQPEARSINQFVSAMQNKVSRIKDEHERASAGLMRLRQALSHGSPQEARACVETLATTLDDLERRCNAITVGHVSEERDRSLSGDTSAIEASLNDA